MASEELYWQPIVLVWLALHQMLLPTGRAVWYLAATSSSKRQPFVQEYPVPEGTATEGLTTPVLPLALLISPLPRR